ncbi:5036_t:CDS:2 [Racocetra persica]|uniref:5036_t:CDS:1 n=1 Tax=Racocetra persica TaxID=160502 RepID=A0ACA9L1I9_9GLOM|nr:5036_t:CDS:2 [Racocetra persica]
MVSILLFILETLITTVTAQQLCVPYTSSFTFTSGYPAIWTTPTSDVFNTQEFQQVNSSIDWSKVPNIKPHTLVNGVVDKTGYSASDPDCWWSYNQCTSPKAPGLQPDVVLCPEPGTLGLTYDDGPNCSHTVFYDFLKEKNQKATMFFIGSNVAAFPYEAKRALTDGHQVCVHTWSHQPMTTLTNDEALAELYYSRKTIKYVMGVTPLYWRPPFGDVDDRIRAIAQQLNLATIIWNLDSNDWNMVPAGIEQPAQIDDIFQGLVDLGKNGTFANSGAIVLQHELNNGTMSKAIEWYPKIKSAYKHVVPIASCMNVTRPYAESNYTYPSFAEYISKNSSSTLKASYISLIFGVIAIFIAQLFSISIF